MKRVIGIMGGCIVAGYEGVTKDDLFFRHLRRWVLESRGELLSVKLASFGDLPHPDYIAPFASVVALEEAKTEASELVGKGVDALVLFIRPSIHWGYCKPLSLYKDGLYLHPIFGGGSKPIFGKLFARVCNKAFQVLFRASGGRLALYRAADNLIEEKLVEILELCRQHATPLFLIGSLIQYHGPFYSRKVRQLFERLENSRLVDAIWIHPNVGPTENAEDDFHLNRNGHLRIAEALYPAVVKELFPESRMG